MVSREEEPPHTSHHGAREISIGKNKEYKKEIILYMDVLKTIHKEISNQKMKSRERDKSILEYVQCMYNNVHTYKSPRLLTGIAVLKDFLCAHNRSTSLIVHIMIRRIPHK